MTYRITLLGSLLLLAVPVSGQDKKYPYALEVSAPRTSMFPQQELQLILTLKNEGDVAGPSLTRASLADVKNILCAAPPTAPSPEATEGQWRGEYALAVGKKRPAGSISLHPGETFTMRVRCKIPEGITEGTRAVFIQWKGRTGALKGLETNQLIMNMQDGSHPIVTLETNQGTMVLELWPDKAPNHVANFISLAKKGHYDGVIFHRVIRGFMVQTGCPDGNGTGGPGYTIPDEFNDTSFRKGVLGMAKTGAPDSAGSQFFIMVADKTHLDGNYTAFGRVLEGQEVADKISQVRTSGGDRPVEEVSMKSVSVALPKGYEVPEVKKSQ